MKGTPLVAISLISTFFVCAAAKNDAPTLAETGFQAHSAGLLAQDKAAKPEAVKTKVWDLAEVVAEHRTGKRPYTRFFRVPSTHCGIYTLPKDGTDGQSPHREDELYYVLAGQAKFRSEGKTVPVKPGSLLYIAAGTKHQFVDIAEDLELLVVFSTGPKQGQAKSDKLGSDAAKAATADAKK